MENSSDRNLGPVWLNDKLFRINGAPLKFHLHGYNENESRSMTQIIEAFGGKSSDPEAPDTFIFCEQSCLFDEEEPDRYDIRYFYESIVAHDSQELISYRLEKLTNQHIGSCMDLDGSILSETEGEYSDDDSFTIHVTSDEDESSSFVDDNQSSHFEDTEIDSSRHQMNTSQRPTSPVNDHLSAYLQHHEHNNNFDGEDCMDEHSSGIEFQDELSESENSSTVPLMRVYNAAQECFVRVERLDDSRIEVGSTHSGDDAQDNEDHNGPEEEMCVSSSEEDGDSEDSSVFQISDVDDLLPPKRRRSTIGQMDKTPRAFWTEEENRVLIQYLIDNDAISRARGKSVWSECLKVNKTLLNPKRTVESLRCNFRSKLRYEYAKYTNDAEARKKFKKVALIHANAGRYSSVWWTEEENRAIIQYLIDNDNIHEANGSNVWSGCLEACQSILHPNRTVQGLRCHFRSKLRYEYAKYTNDAEALQKFMKICTSKA